MKSRLKSLPIILMLLISFGIVFLGVGYGAALPEEEGVYRVNLSPPLRSVYPGEEITFQITTFLDKYKPPKPGEPPKPLSPGDWVYIGDVPLRFEIKDETGALIDLDIPQDLRTDDHGSLEITFKAPEKEGKYTMTIFAVIEGKECSDSGALTVSSEERPPLPTPIPGIQLELFNLHVFTNGTVSFNIRLHEYESQVLEEVRVNDLRYSWSDGSPEDATILRDETRTWRRNVGSFNPGERVHVVVRATDESGGGYAVVETPPTPTPVPTPTPTTPTPTPTPQPGWIGCRETFVYL
ncbi:MAG: hypothetical protein ACE5Z5_13365, partial [Candidatus Bathyarchaeia archaeon]